MLSLIIVLFTLIIWLITKLIEPKSITSGAECGGLEREYRRYKYVEKILNIVSKGNNKYETRNIVERWLLSMVNFSENFFDEVFSNDIFDESCRFNDQMRHELREKTAMSDADIDNLIKKVISIVREYKSNLISLCEDAQFTITGGRFTYRDYTRDLAPARMDLLRARGGDFNVARMLLRYASILPGAQHWNMPRDNYLEYYSRGITIEGFASPVNVQLITINDECKFCSLFPDVDAPFGSIGNFFKPDFIGKKVAVGPPYTVELFDKIAKKIHEQCTKAEREGKSVLFYVTFSAWEDTDGFKNLRDSKWCRYAAILPAYKHFYVNTNLPGEPKVNATFNTAFFAISVGLPPESYENLFDGMSVDGHIQMKIIKN